MNKFQSYLEWLPEKFKEERAKGTLDVKAKPEKKVIPEWLKLPLAAFKNFGSPIKNGKPIIDERLVLTPNDYYAADRGIHMSIIAWLMSKGVVPQNSELLYEWHNKSPNVTNLLCLQVDFNDQIRLSESYNFNGLGYLMQDQAAIKRKFAIPLKKLEAQGFEIVWEAIDS